MISGRDRELIISLQRVSRTIYCLRQGAPPESIDPEYIGVSADEMPELIEIAKRQMAENEKNHAEMTRKIALGLIAFGVVMLTIAFSLSQGEVPLLRQGRLILGFLAGGASLGWGLFRFFNHNPKYDFF